MVFSIINVIALRECIIENITIYSRHKNTDMFNNYLGMYLKDMRIK